MARVFITGSADGLGRETARTLLAAGHEVVIHARNRHRREAVRDLIDAGARAVVGDLAHLDEVRQVADAVHRLGRMDAIIHNAGVYHGPEVMPVNIVAPYLLTALIEPPARLVYLSSSEHYAGYPGSLADTDWAGHTGGSYPSSKLFVTALAFAVARRWPHTTSNAVDPGWVPTRMGGPNAPDDLRLGHLTQEWLAVSDDPDAHISGGYWHHQKRRASNPAAADPTFQDALLAALAEHTGMRLLDGDEHA